MPSSIPEVAQDLISRLLVLKPEDRLGADNIYELIEH